VKDTKKRERVTFTSLEEFDRAFFPDLAEETQEAEEDTNATTRAAEIAQHALSTLVR